MLLACRDLQHPRWTREALARLINVQQAVLNFRRQRMDFAADVGPEAQELLDVVDEEGREFLDFVIDELKSQKLPAGAICFEITETAAISNLSRVVYFMQTLKRLGCKFSLDDFGSGLSSFTYLKNLPVDYLKIDGQFIRHVADDTVDESMVKAIR